MGAEEEEVKTYSELAVRIRLKLLSEMERWVGSFRDAITDLRVLGRPNPLPTQYFWPRAQHDARAHFREGLEAINPGSEGLSLDEDSRRGGEAERREED